MDPRKLIEDEDDVCYYPSEGYDQDPCDDDDGAMKEAPVMSRGCQGTRPRHVPQCQPCDRRGGSAAGVVVSVGQNLSDGAYNGPTQVPPTVPASATVGSATVSQVPRGGYATPPRRMAPPPSGVPAPPPAADSGGNIKVDLAVQHQFTFDELLAETREDGVMRKSIWRVRPDAIITIFRKPKMVLKGIKYFGHTTTGSLPTVVRILPDSLGLNTMFDEYGNRFAFAVEPGDNVRLEPENAVNIYTQKVEIQDGAEKYAGMTLEELVNEEGVERNGITGEWTIKRRVKGTDGSFSGPELGAFIALNQKKLGANSANPDYFVMSDANMGVLQQCISAQVINPTKQTVLDVAEFAVVVEARMPPDVTSTKQDLASYWREALLDYKQTRIKARQTMHLQIEGTPVARK